MLTMIHYIALGRTWLNVVVSLCNALVVKLQALQLCVVKYKLHIVYVCVAHLSGSRISDASLRR